MTSLVRYCYNFFHSLIFSNVALKRYWKDSCKFRLIKMYFYCSLCSFILLYSVQCTLPGRSGNSGKYAQTAFDLSPPTAVVNAKCFNVTCHEISLCVLIRSSLFCVVAQRKLLSYRRFGTDCRSNLQGSRRLMVIPVKQVSRCTCREQWTGPFAFRHSYWILSPFVVWKHQ